MSFSYGNRCETAHLQTLDSPSLRCTAVGFQGQQAAHTALHHSPVVLTGLRRCEVHHEPRHRQVMRAGGPVDRQPGLPQALGVGHEDHGAVVQDGHATGSELLPPALQLLSREELQVAGVPETRPGDEVGHRPRLAVVLGATLQHQQIALALLARLPGGFEEHSARRPSSLIREPLVDLPLRTVPVGGAEHHAVDLLALEDTTCGHPDVAHGLGQLQIPHTTQK